MRNPRDRPLRFATAALLGLCLLEILVWLPGYLTRPLFADHDVFATMARGWDAGFKPYRDLVSNNFPGTIYLFWGLGKAFGWGNVPALYAADAALLLVLVAMTLLWSRARFGRALPGAVGVVAILCRYLDLDFSQTAQRDWHASVLVVLGLMAAQAWPSRGGRWLAALGFSLGLLVRPQVILFLPALLLAVTERPRLADSPRSGLIKAATIWLAVVAILLVLGFLPLLRDGVMGDFLEGLQAVAWGGAYNKKSTLIIAIMLRDELIVYRIAAMIASLFLMARGAGGAPGRSLATTWFVALLGALFYAPISPGGQNYLCHPLWLTWSIGLAGLVGLVLDSDVPPKGALYVLLALSVAGLAWPRYCRLAQVPESLAALRKGRETWPAPAGYEHPYGNRLTLPPWEDYRAVLEYIRTGTTPGTRVANLVKGLAITGSTARFSALPAESATWVFVVKPDDEEKFARALEAYPDSVVVKWAPGQEGSFDHPLPKLEEVVNRLYVIEARFGTLEVWRRRPKDQEK
jgi:hypothetical protein